MSQYAIVVTVDLFKQQFMEASLQLQASICQGRDQRQLAMDTRKSAHDNGCMQNSCLLDNTYIKEEFIHLQLGFKLPKHTR